MSIQGRRALFACLLISTGLFIITWSFIGFWWTLGIWGVCSIVVGIICWVERKTDYPGLDDVERAGLKIKPRDPREGEW